MNLNELASRVRSEIPLLAQRIGGQPLVFLDNGPTTKLVSIGHVSNVTGAIAPVEEVVRIAHAHGVPVLLDAAQSLSHLPIDVVRLGVDFLAASSHKAFGPSGVGILWGKKDFLQ